MLWCVQRQTLLEKKKKKWNLPVIIPKRSVLTWVKINYIFYFILYVAPSLNRRWVMTVSPLGNHARKWEITPLIRLGSNLYFFAAFHCSCLGCNALFVLWLEIITSLNSRCGREAISAVISHFLINCGSHLIRGSN